MNDDPKKKPKDNTVFGLPGSPPTGGSGDMKQASPQKSDKPPAAPADSPFVVNPQRRSSYPPPKFTGPSPAIGVKPIPPAAAKPPVPVAPGAPVDPSKKLAAKTILGMPVMAPVAKPGQAAPAPAPAVKPAPPGAFSKPATPQPVTDGTFRNPPKAPTEGGTPQGPTFKAEKEGFAPTMMAYMPGPIQGPPQPQPVTTGALKRPSKPPPPPPYQQQPQAAYQPPQPAGPAAPVVPVVGPAAGFQPEPYQTPAQSPYQVPVVSQDNYTPPEEQYGPDYGGSAGAQAQGGAPQPYQAGPYQGGGQPPQWQPPPQSPGGYPPYGGGPGAPGGMPPAGAPPQQPKKKSPLIFVGIGCGALLILGIIITVIVIACSMCAAKGASSTTDTFLYAQLEKVQKQCDAQIETIKKDSNISSDQKDQMVKDIEKGCDLSIKQTKKALNL